MSHPTPITVEMYSPVLPPTTFSLDQHTFLPSLLPDAEQRLQSLVAALEADLDVLSYPCRTWNYQQDKDVLEVAIIGAGHTGKSVAFGLRRHGIEHIRIFDAKSPGQEGPWRSYARNRTLRTPKQVTGGLDWGIANLNFRRWCCACYGDDYWQQMQFIPRLLWAEYLDWYAQVLQLPIQHNTPIDTVTWNEAGQHFCLETPQSKYSARFVILAMGIESSGGKAIPALVCNSLPVDCYAHTSDDINFAALKDQRVVVVGGGASAFDNAIAALSAGAASVDIVMRRAQIPNINRIRWSEWNGYHRHYIDLDDRTKWYYTLEELKLGQLPPTHTYYEAMSDSRLTLYTSAPVTKLQHNGHEILGTYGGKEMRHDFLICATGFATDIAAQPELRALISHIALWKDRYQPEPGSECAALSNYPYLGRSLEFLPKQPEHGYLRRLYYLSSGIGWLSGFRAYLSGLQFAAPRVCYDISRQLFLQHQPEIIAAFDRYAVAEYPLPKPIKCNPNAFSDSQPTDFDVNHWLNLS